MERTYACQPCEVSWRSTDPACWSCGALVEAAAAPRELDISVSAARMRPAAQPAVETALTRWGRNVGSVQSLGLPDPRLARAISQAGPWQDPAA